MRKDQKLQGQEIGREFYGYKKEDVDRLLAELHLNLRLAQEKNADLETELTEARQRLLGHEELAKTLNKTIENAERAASEIVTQARDEAGSIIAKAGEEASELLEAAKSDRRALEQGRARLQEIEQDLEARIKSVFESYLDLVERIKPNGSMDAGRAEIESPRSLPRFPEAVEMLIRDSLERLLRVRGIVGTWVFVNDGALLSAMNGLQADLRAATESFVALDTWFSGAGLGLPGQERRLLFLELSDFLLVLHPVTGGTTLGVIAGAGVDIREMFSAVAGHVEEIEGILG